VTGARPSDSIEIIQPDWTAPARVHAAFTLRTGGVSRAPYDSLNLGERVEDEPESVRENRRRVVERLRLPAEPAWLEQVHGTRIADLDAGDEGPADGVLTRQAGRVCVVQVADCLPVLFTAQDGSAVAAAHAGWRGLAAGVLEATVAKLAIPPARLRAWLGPAIGREHFEVGEEVRAAFMAGDAGAASAFRANARGRWQCDLAVLARRRLLELGLGGVSGGEWCAYADRARFFSYRRDGRCGRMAALIWLSP
jgi:polyphenol oxidase